MLNIGDLVRAKVYILDIDHHGQPYIHAMPGDVGVVVDDDSPAEFPNISWGRCGEGGVCNVRAEYLDAIPEYDTNHPVVRKENWIYVVDPPWV